MRAALACLALGSLVGCGGGGGTTAGPKRPMGPAIAPELAQQGASDLLTEIYETLGHGNKDSLFTLLEDSLMVFGPRGADMLGTRADALVALGQVVDPKSKKHLEIRSSKIDVAAAPGGHSAVAFDTASINGQQHTILAVLTNTNDLWLVGAVAVARAPEAAQLKAELARDAVVPPGAVGAKKLDPAARPAVEKFQRGLLDQAAWGDELARHAGAIVVGPTEGEVARGKQAIRELWKKRLGAKTRAAIAGELTAAVTSDGQLAWVSAPITRVEGEGTQPLPLRAFAVYQRDGGDWSLLALSEQLAFSEPGAGAPFKKFLPPRPAEPKPEVIADRPKDKDKGTKTALDTTRPAKKKKRPEAEGEAPRKKVQAKAGKSDDADLAPRKKKKRTFGRSDDDGDEARADEPRKKVKAKEAKEAKDSRSEDAEEAPRKKKKRTFARNADADDADDATDAAPSKKAKAKKADEEADELPKKKAKKAAKVDEEAEEAPKKKVKARKAAKADEEAEEAPKKTAAKKAAKAEEEAEEAPKKATTKAKPKAEETPKETPKKKPAPVDDDEIEVID